MAYLIEEIFKDKVFWGMAGTFLGVLLTGIFNIYNQKQKEKIIYAEKFINFKAEQTINIIKHINQLITAISKTQKELYIEYTYGWLELINIIREFIFKEKKFEPNEEEILNLLNQAFLPLKDKIKEIDEILEPQIISCLACIEENKIFFDFQTTNILEDFINKTENLNKEIRKIYKITDSKETFKCLSKFQNYLNMWDLANSNALITLKELIPKDYKFQKINNPFWGIIRSLLYLFYQFNVKNKKEKDLKSLTFRLFKEVGILLFDIKLLSMRIFVAKSRLIIMKAINFD